MKNSKFSPFSRRFQVKWYKGTWYKIFEGQVKFIQEDIRRAEVEDRVVVYLSCPISSRGGGYYGTNVEIANHTAHRLMMEWGSRFWILNPCQYQLESKEGTGLIKRHAETLKLKKEIDINIDIDELAKDPATKPQGGDYMRMWTRVLVEDGGGNRGSRFGAYYFIGPSDVWKFFTQGGATSLTAGVEEYFARKFTMDPDFRKDFSEGDIGKPEWEKMRKDFFLFYTVRASVNYSMGSHDEWNIWKTLNELRLKHEQYGHGSQIAGYFDGKQIDPGAAESGLSKGYATHLG